MVFSVPVFIVAGKYYFFVYFLAQSGDYDNPLFSFLYFWVYKIVEEIRLNNEVIWPKIL